MLSFPPPPLFFITVYSFTITLSPPWAFTSPQPCYCYTTNKPELINVIFPNPSLSLSFHPCRQPCHPPSPLPSLLSSHSVPCTFAATTSKPVLTNEIFPNTSLDHLSFLPLSPTLLFIISLSSLFLSHIHFITVQPLLSLG